MTNALVEIITSADPRVRNRSLDSWCETASAAELLAACDALDAFRRESHNLYEQVRALFFLHAIHRYHLPRKPAWRPEAIFRSRVTGTCSKGALKRRSTFSSAR